MLNIEALKVALDADAGLCPTCGWRPGTTAGAAQPAQSPPSTPAGRLSAGRDSSSGFDLWSVPKWLWAIPIVAVLIAGHVAFPHLPWSRYAVRFGNAWDTDGFHVAAGLCVLFAGVGLTVLLAWLLRRGR